MYNVYVILIFRSWNFVCGTECKVAKIKLNEIFIKKFNIRVFFKLQNICRGSGRVGEDFRIGSCKQLPTHRSLEWKIFAVRTCSWSFCRIDAISRDGRIVRDRRKPLYAFSSSLVIALRNSSEPVTLTRSIVPSESRVLGGISNYSSSV